MKVIKEDSEFRESTAIEAPPVPRNSHHFMESDYRRGEFGYIGAEQGDETHYDTRKELLDDCDGDNEGAPRIQFSKKKLYGREKELVQLGAMFQRVTSGPQQSSTGAADADKSMANGTDDTAPQPADTGACIVNGTDHNDNNNDTPGSTPATATTTTLGQAEAMFISGYSGCGKSALFYEFIKQQQERNNNKDQKKLHNDSNNNIILLKGKYDELQAMDPFSAITTALSRWCYNLSPLEVEELQDIRPHVEEAIGFDDVHILMDLVPSLSRLLLRGRRSSSGMVSIDTASSRLSRSTAARKGFGLNKTRIKYIFQSLIRAMASCRPLVMFLDDLQWSDDASLELLAALLGDVTLQNMMFVGAYRSNEVQSEDHPLRALLNDLSGGDKDNNDDNTPKKDSRVEMMELSELDRTHIGEFIADTLMGGDDEEDDEDGYEDNDNDEEDLDDKIEQFRPLTDAIYSKALGNVFMTMQAVEQLVRKNALYYDTMIFQWQWNLSKDQLQDQLSDDIIDMVKSKIEQMPQKLQEVLVMASYIRATFDVDTLLFVMMHSTTAKAAAAAIINEQEKQDLVQHLDRAVMDGLLLDVAAGSHSSQGEELKEYMFAHDRIQEAARSIPAEGETHDKLLIRIGKALAARCFDDEEVDGLPDAVESAVGGMEEGEDWMLFTAAHHLNSVPSHYHDNSAKVQLAKLNLMAAQVSTGVAGFEEAAKSLRAGIAVLEDGKLRWSEKNYDLTLELYNHLLDVDFGLGNYEQLKEGIDEVLANATSIKDKGQAFVHSVGIISIAKERDHAKALNKGKEILSLLGIDILAVDIDDVKPADIKEQEKLCKAALGKQKIKDLFDAEVMEEETVLLVLDKMAGSSVMSGRLAFNYILSRVALRWCATHGISPILPKVMVYECLYFQKTNSNYKQSYEVAVLCMDMLHKIPGITPGIRCKVRGGCYNGGFVLQNQPLSASVEAFLECYGDGIKAGDTEWAFITAMCYGIVFFASGSQITALTEAKFAFYEEQCRQFRQPPSVSVIFSILRQFVLGLQCKSANPLVFDGKAMTEKAVLGNFDPESSTYKQTLRDMSTMKLMMACILGDLSTVEEMISILITWPNFDILICRGFGRIVWVSFGCFALARAGIKSKTFLETARKNLKWFQDGSRKGNLNDKAAFLCLQAENKQTKKNYDVAIKQCADLGFLHMEAVMNERCGLCQLERKKQQHAEAYLTQAIRVYHKWGATAKVVQMKKEHSFLQSWNPHS